MQAMIGEAPPAPVSVLMTTWNGAGGNSARETAAGADDPARSAGLSARPP